jgi:peroxiredoxin
VAVLLISLSVQKHPSGKETEMKSLALVCEANRKVTALLIFVGAVLLLVNVLLAQQNKKLRVLASRPDRTLEVRAGTVLPTLEGVGSHGNRHSISYGQDARKTVLLVFSPRCRACGENLLNWDAIINGIDRRSFRLFAISLQSKGFNEYADRYRVNDLTILTEVDPKYRVAYNLALTPQTILIGVDGKVERVWTGLFQKEDKKEIEQALNVRLP